MWVFVPSELGSVITLIESVSALHPIFNTGKIINGITTGFNQIFNKILAAKIAEAPV
jgi:hypothetical protein